MPTQVMFKVVAMLDWGEGDSRGISGTYRHRPVWVEWPHVAFDDAQKMIDQINDTDPKWAAEDPAARGHRGPHLPFGNQQVYFLDSSGVRRMCINTEPWRSRLSGADTFYVNKTRLLYVCMVTAPFTHPWG